MKRLFIGLANSSLLWGLVATFAFYYALNAGYIENETIVRYCAGHPVEYATVAMFWVGLVDLLLKTRRTRAERSALKRGAFFPPKRAEKEPLSKVDDYLATIAKARDVRGDSVYLRRLTDALDFLKYGGSPEDLDQELRLLADDAYDRRDGEYGLARTFIWAIPILGFLGTVLGITVALGSLDLTQLEATGDKLASGLKVAFDTTALALSLVFVLYFLQFFSRKQDAALASSVSRLVDSELRGRFCSDRDDDASGASDAFSKRLNAVVDAFGEATRAQTEVWTNATSDLARKNLELASTIADRLGDALGSRFDEYGSGLARALDDSRRTFVEGTLRPILDESLRKVARLDSLEGLVTQETEALREALKACADVAALDERLTTALERLAQVGEFEKTLNNLSATVCLLNSKLTSAPTQNALAQEPTSRAARRANTLAALDAIGSLERSVEDVEPAVAPTRRPSLTIQGSDALDEKPRSSDLSTDDAISISPLPFLDEIESSERRTEPSPKARAVLSKKRAA